GHRGARRRATRARRPDGHRLHAGPAGVAVAGDDLRRDRAGAPGRALAGGPRPQLMAPTSAGGDVFAALADPTRRAVLRAVVDQGPVTATQLAAELPISRQAVAKHL